MSDEYDECAPLAFFNNNNHDGKIKYIAVKNNVNGDTVTNDEDNDHNDNDNDDDGDDDDDVGYNYKQPFSRFRNLTSRYSGYATLGSHRVSLHDSWDFDCGKDNNDADNDDHDNYDAIHRPTNQSSSFNDGANGDNDDDNGNFISFWSNANDGSCNDARDNVGERKNNPQHYEEEHPRTVSSANNDNNDEHDEHDEHDNNKHDNDDDDDDDRVETTMRPIPLMYRQQHSSGEMSWFQRELGLSNVHVVKENNNNNNPRSRRRRTWGLWRRQRQHPDDNVCDFEEFDNSDIDGNDDHDDDDDIVANSLLDNSSSSDEIGHYMPNIDGGIDDVLPVPRAHSPFRYSYNTTRGGEDFTKEGNIFGSRRRGEGMLLGLPIIRPFLRGSRRGFTDDTVAKNNNASVVEEDDDDSNGVDDYAGNDVQSRRDRAAVVQSISQGISGTNDDSLLLDSTTGVVENGQQSSSSSPTTTNRQQQQRPNLFERIFTTRRFLANHPDNNNNNNKTAILQLHNHLRKENWSLATVLLESNPNLARTWHPVDRLYGGRYDGEALPIHAACALRPPPSFIELLGRLYPDGLVEKDKAFGRVPLHVACRSLAESGVIRVLCEMDPKCVEERDTLKRVPLHYLIKNYSTFGDDNDDDDDSIDEDNVADTTIDDNNTNGEKNNNNDDGMIALKLFIETNPACVRATDHRGWLPIHVACSCSSRKGMIRVMRVLLKAWPESVNCKTDKNSDAFACVDMAGKIHPTKDRVLALLHEVRSKIERRGMSAVEENSEGCDGDDAAIGNGDEDDVEHEDQSLSDKSVEESNSSLPQCETTLEEQKEHLHEEEECTRSTLSSGETHPIIPCPEEGILIDLEEARSKLERSGNTGDDNSEGCDDEAAVENRYEDVVNQEDQSLSERSVEEGKSSLPQCESTPEEQSKQLHKVEECITTLSSGEKYPAMAYPEEGVLINL